MSHSNPSIEPFPGQRCTYTTSKPYDNVLQAVRGSVACLSQANDIIASANVQNATSNQFEAVVQKAVQSAENPSGFVLFMEIDHGKWYQLFHPDHPRLHKFVIGNPLELKNMAEYDVTSTLNAPWNFLVIEVPGKGAKIVFDLPSGTVVSEVGGEGLKVKSKALEEKFKKMVNGWL